MDNIRSSTTGTEAGKDREASDGLLRHGEAQLACGIALLGVAALLAPQVMIGLLGLMLLPLRHGTVDPDPRPFDGAVGMTGT